MVKKPTDYTRPDPPEDVVKHRQECAKRLIAYREHLGLTQAEYGRMVGVAVTTLSQYEVGKSRPTIDFALTLQRRSGISLDYLFAGKFEGLPFGIASDLRERLKRLR